MGRRRAFRDFPLWVRLKRANLDFLDKVCKLSGLNRTEFIDLHLEFMRDNTSINEVTKLVSKAGNDIQGKDKAAP